MLAPWVTEEMQTVSLQDRRLDSRLQEVLSQLAARPTASIPAACGGRSEMEAAYRLFDNDKVTFENILQSHQETTRRRIAEQPLVIAAQDTTEIDFTRPEAQVLGAGPLSDGGRRGLFLHLLHAFTPDGTALGTVEARPWVREEGPSLQHSLTLNQRKRRPLEEKESYRWVSTLRQAHELARQCPQTRIVCVADSEADIYELLVEGTSRSQGAAWIVRAYIDRALEVEKGEVQATHRHLREKLLAQPVLFTKTIKVRARKAKLSCDRHLRRQPRQSRQAEMEVRAGQVILRPPPRQGQKLPPLTVNVVLVREINPPNGDTPVEWLLLTSLPVESIEQVREVIECYCVRWMIEVFFRTLKSGCRVEERRFETMDRQLRCLAVYLIVAWRTLYVCRLGQAFPDISCEAIFEPAEWKSVYRVVQQKLPPQEPPTLGAMVRMVAQLGGYVNRPRKQPPGPQTLWLGLQRMHDFALCWELFGPGAKINL
jgi:transposase-like protein/transposase Tn5 family protein